MKKRVIYEMSHGEWSELQPFLDRSYAIASPGEKRLTISSRFNGDGICGEVKFSKEPHGSVKVGVTSPDLEERIDFIRLVAGSPMNCYPQNQLPGEEFGIEGCYKLEN